MTAEPFYPLHRAEDAEAVPASPNLPGIERDVLAYWDADHTFQASIDQRPAGEQGENEFVFYDGPPFANGLPHYGHLLTGYAKDVVPRFQTMRGKRVERRFGWDTHGLPAELEAMSQLGIKTKDEILSTGIEAFNEACRASVMKYADEWRDYVTRQARWVDFENDYKTLEPDYMESVIWAFKQLHSKGLAYEGFRVLPYCWNDQTPLSNHELRMDDDVYAQRQDPALTVGFEITTPGPFQGVKALIWTTTPWTLPANLAVVVGADVEYVVVESAGPTGSTERYLLAEARLEAHRRELAQNLAEGDELTVTWRGTGAELVDLSYTPPFRYYAGHEKAFRLVTGDFVTTTDGTGLVHAAGAFGEDDKAITDREGIEAVMPVGPDGAFTAPVSEYAGVQVFDANPLIIEHLKAATRAGAAGAGADTGAVSPGTVLFRRETYDHSYPHCWRCRQPLIYKGVSSWFVAVTEFKDRMLELNQQINWAPEHIKDGQFGKWLENARDWSISRNRFWGSPIPVWKSDDPEYPRVDVYGSFAEIEADFGELPRNARGEVDLHRPYVDQLTRPNPDDPRPEGQRSTMRRVEDVLDVWFDSGAMTFAQVHYPFENADWFEHHFPGDFIVEYIGQTRGWFYTLHILATALFDRPAFGTCMCHGIILGDDGHKASKSRRNYPDVNETFETHGSDAVRWFLMASPILRGGTLAVTEQGIRDAVRTILLPLWNTWYFFALYSGTVDGGQGYRYQPINVENPDEAERARIAGLDVMDRYLLAHSKTLADKVSASLEAYEVAEACARIREHIDLLTNWYVRTSRDRFWSEDRGAFDTLGTALEVLCRVMAPVAPLVTEEIWRGLTGGRSVHLADWPHLSEAVADPELMAAMDTAREVVSAAHALRKAAQVRVRQPLRALTFVAPAESTGIAGFTDLIAAEVNVKEVVVRSLAEGGAEEFGVVTRLSVNARAAGPRLGKQVQQAIQGARAGDWQETAEGVTAGGVALHDGEYELHTQVAAEGDDSARAAQLLPGGGFVVLDLAVDEELAAEGYARDLVRQVQDERKNSGLHVADRIHLELTVPADKVAWVEAHRDLIARETLAVQVVVITGESVQVRVTKGSEAQ
ncbi:isoleucine--tRNA ligase [Bogoriella caseilytica]|uniref:Isoleucine--tRNA ligase n=1 Tax=Bogoriella caseilytica TaxID=56055 RepID=A0A3N2BFD1_9MICO|nr:isoleucine--tRNA ligase [Bogoriella caseilytica]ROR73957.1 isoleucyl-tRNA synthetase [Bogoriella caseilytica]